MLDFESDFRFNGAVSAADQVPSLTGVIPADAGGDGAVAFTTTHWSVVLTAQGQSPVADEALEKLCRLYWWPLYGFVRRQGYAPEEAQDLTQGFFAMLLERRDLDAVRRQRVDYVPIFSLHSKISSPRRIGARWPSNVVREDRL